MDKFDRNNNEFNPNNRTGLGNIDESGLEDTEPSMFIPDQTTDEELAADMTAFDEHAIINRDSDYDGDDQYSNVPGWIALALSIISFFIMPIIIGLAAIIVGFVARNRDSLWLGNIAIAIGVISIIVRLLLIPFA